MNNKQQLYLTLLYWLVSLDGKVKVAETKFIKKSKLVNLFYSDENFEFCKSIVEKQSGNNSTDTLGFLKQILKGIELTADESKNLIKELCLTASSDGEFSNIEKKYIELLANELGLVDENIIDEFEKKNTKTSTPFSSLNNDSSLKLRKKSMDLVFNANTLQLKPILQNKLENNIKKELSLDGFDLKISNLLITKTRRLVVQTLFDERIIKERREINYRGVRESRSKSESDIDLYSNTYKRNDLDFVNLSQNQQFRVDGTNETQTCLSCRGNRQVTCYNCDGAGKNRCSNCSGRGDISCSSCSGDGRNSCWSCGGDGSTSEYNSDLGRSVSKRCNSCSGQGYNPCRNCGQTGRVTCSNCSGSGQVICYSCSGTGKVDCSSCNAQGSFTDYLIISSTLKDSSNKQFLDGEPNVNFCSVNTYTEEYDYHKLYGKYEFKNLKEHSSELKNLFSSQNFANNQLPKKIKFKLDDCASMIFDINVGGNIYQGGLNENGELLYDKTILDQLFFNIIKTLDIKEDFKALESIKIPITLQIPEFKDTFAKIKEYKILDQTIISNTKNEVKLDAIRKLNKTNISKYESFLINTIGKKNKLLSLVITLIGYTSIWFFLPSWTSLIVLLFVLNIAWTFTRIAKHLGDKKKSAASVGSNRIKTFLVIFIISIVFVFSWNQADADFPFENNLPMLDPFEINVYGFDLAFLSQSDRDLQTAEKIKSRIDDSMYSGSFGSLDFGDIDIDLINEEVFKIFRISFNLVSSEVLKDSKFVYGYYDNTDSIIILKPSNTTKSYFYIKEGSDYRMNISPYRVEDSKYKVYIDIDETGYSQVKSNYMNKSWSVSRIGLGDDIVVKGGDIVRDERKDYGFYYILDDYNTFKYLGKPQKRSGNDYKISLIYEAFVGEQTFDMVFNPNSDYNYIATQDNSNSVVNQDNQVIEDELEIIEAQETERNDEIKRNLKKQKEREKRIAEQKSIDDAKKKEKELADAKRRAEKLANAKRRAKELADAKKQQQLLEKKQSVKSYKIWFSSDKKSKVYLRRLKKMIKKIKKDYNIELDKIHILQPPGITNYEDAITAYFLQNINDLNKFKEIANEYNMAKLYVEDSSALILYYSGK
ncbi:hypothetical protein N9Q89_03675 [Flavobacteriaceae bacterium]|nr:hypothetical protein [Flavobacteriaceae bacterium]